ncbi:MAG: HD-GYP domain-containing protein [Candidatus Omnitrophica bacterium]|nr:HD-GYP domain-containing protein [Candidatus Omnitrophota bacterium]
MSIDYKKELEKASKRMILVHDPDLLIRLMIRMIVQKVRVTHCSILLHDRVQDSYILTVSGGRTGLKVPEGFTRMDLDNPLVRFFRETKNKSLLNNEVLVYEEAKKLTNLIADSELKDLLSKVLYQMDLFETTTCIPSYFRDELMGILLLGNKNTGAKFDMDELSFFIALSQDVAMNIRNAQLIQELKNELDNKQSLFINTTKAMAAAIEAKDRYTHGHTSRVTTYALEIAKKLEQKNKKVTDKKFLGDIQIASLLHDIGKIGVPESILNKEGLLDPEERKKINEHPMIGVNILQPIHELETVLMGVKYHHERFDGNGYPEGLKGDKIPLIAAIISVADSFDAMTSDRPYRKGFAREKAIDIIKQESGKQFDPYIVEIFLETVAENKI